LRALQELNDLEDIRNLRLEYTHCMDSGDLEGLLALYTDDAVCDFANFGHWKGKDEMRKGWTPYVIKPVPYAGGRHVCTNPRVRINGDTATSEAYLIDIVYTDRATGEVRDNPIALLGMYVDECTRVNGEWKIAKTTLHFLWPQAGGGPANLVRAGQRRQPDDHVDDRTPRPPRPGERVDRHQ